MLRAFARIAVIAAVGAVPLLVAGAQPVGTASTEIAMVANAEAGTIALVDVAARAVVGTIDVNPERAKSEGPGAPNFAQDTDVSPDGRTIYVSRGYLGDVVAFDISSGKQLWRRSLSTGRADHMTLTPDGSALFVSAMMDNRVFRVSTRAGEITGHVVTGIYPHDNKVSKDGAQIVDVRMPDLAGVVDTWLASVVRRLWQRMQRLIRHARASMVRTCRSS